MAGSDGFVTVPDEIEDVVAAGWVGGRNIIDENVTLQQSMVAEARAYAQPALEQLIDMIEGGILPTNWKSALDNVVFTGLTSIGASDPLTAPTLTLPPGWDPNIPVLGALRDVPALDIDDIEAVRPDRPTHEFSYVPGTYSSPIFETVFNAIYDGLQNDGILLSEETQDLILSQLQRRQQTLRDTAYQQKMDAIGADGFDLAGGAEAQIIATHTNLVYEEDSAASRDISIKMAEMANDNRKFLIDSAKALEQMERDFFNSAEGRSLEAAKELAQFILTRYDTEARVYLQDKQAQKLELEKAIATVEVVEKQNKIVLDRYLGELEGEKLLAEVRKAIAETITTGNSGEVEVFKAKVLERSERLKALSEEQRNVILNDELRLKKATTEVELLVNAILGQSKMKADITKDLVALLAQIIASALAANHTSVTHGTTKSTAAHQSVSNSASISSSHSFDETATS